MLLPTPYLHEDKDCFVARCFQTLTREEADLLPLRTQRIVASYFQWHSYQKEHAPPEKVEK